jgi:Bax protein
MNINRKRAYKLLREIRAYKRIHNLRITGKSLSEGLNKYSLAGYEYIELVQRIIRQNNLTRFD